MSTQKQNQDRQATLEITLKALRDASFKEKLMANPLGTIKELYPEFSSEFKVVVTDQTAPKTVYINISQVMAALLYEGIEEMELCEEDLEIVSGGTMAANDTNYGCGANVYKCTVKKQQ